MNSFESSWMTEKVTPSQGSWEGEVSVGTWAVEIHNLICLQILFKLKQQVANCGGCTAEGFVLAKDGIQCWWTRRAAEGIISTACEPGFDRTHLLKP